MKQYYILAFDDAKLVRCTAEKYESLQPALQEQYGAMTACHYATTPRKNERVSIASGNLQATWYRILRAKDGWKRELAPEYKPPQGRIE